VRRAHVRLGGGLDQGRRVVALGAAGPTAYSLVAGFPPSHEVGRVLAAYGRVVTDGSLPRGVAFHGFGPDSADVLGAANCLMASPVIMYGRRAPSHACCFSMRFGRAAGQASRSAYTLARAGGPRSDCLR
jgi:drug/metabolite transporter superfamily protein YnfA